ncbi:MAG: alpha-1,4-glucan--maltose-1-phosphate maltosyltransferase [Dehalococcoidia bacterium]
MESPIDENTAPSRVVIEHVTPEVDAGRFAVKRVTGDVVHVEADIFADGHDVLDAHLFYRHESEVAWHDVRMTFVNNDHWFVDFPVETIGTYVYRIEAWVDAFATWRRDFRLRLQVNQDIESELQVAAGLLAAASHNATGEASTTLAARSAAVAASTAIEDRAQLALDDALIPLMVAHAPRGSVASYDRGQRIQVDRPLARFSAWYEMFPRSTAGVAGKHGTFRETMTRLPYISELGFDILYLPPIHPIGEVNRKGRNNAPRAEAGDHGSPWGIGSKLGGHTAVHPDLGTLEDFRALLTAAKERGIEVALDIAYQVAPDHPWVKEHPQWFKHRPDGTIRYAENPPKKYEDIYPIDFETKDWQALWAALEDVIRFWIEQGVTVFRVDNPHTKAFAFWEHMIGRVKKDHPETIFLSEAFTRPRVRYYLAKLGFTQSYTYFAWRNTKQELTEYLTELTTTEVKDYFRPNFWPNTPDILHESLQEGGRGAFASRYVLAATLSSNCGIYGPAYELGVNTPRERGTEDYLDSEKYEIKVWDIDAPGSIRGLISRVNRIRRENPALQLNETIRFHETDSNQLLAYSKTDRSGGNVILTVVNLDPHVRQSGMVRLPVDELGLPWDTEFEVHDLLSDNTYRWRGEWQFIDLNPIVQPAHIFSIPAARTGSRPVW